MAQQADRYDLYQHAVQSSEGDVALLASLYRRTRRATPHHLREDFCGAGATLCAWIRQGKTYSGEGYDIDPEPLDWGRRHNFAPLGAARRRASLRAADARTPSIMAPDVRCAFNFSYWIFRERAVLLEYFSAVRHDLAAGGIFVIDVQGGSEVFSEEEQISDCGDFTLVCHQTNVRPVDHCADLALHFRFPDGSELRGAFRYHWRIWSMPELTDLLHEAGFTRLQYYWCVDGKNGTRYQRTKRGDNDAAWIACVVALK